MGKMASLLATLLLVAAAASPARAAMAAWWNEIGPQIVLRNETTNQIRYSPCNSFGEARFSSADDRVLELEHNPKTGTPITGVGWYNRVLTVASIFYMDDEGNIATAVYHCNMDTGMLRSQGNFIISADVPSIHSNSGIAAVVLGQQGYRVYYHDSDGAINELAYMDKGWRYRGTISSDINALPALAAAYSGTENITVASSRDERNIAVTKWNRDGTWFRSTLPQPLQGGFTTAETDRDDTALNETATANFTLPAWDGKTTSIGISIDKASARSLWYIGDDNTLHHATTNQNLTWTQPPNQPPNTSWPRADKPNTDLAVAYNANTSMVRIYYLVNNHLAELKFENNTWHPWSAIPTPSPPPPPSPPPSPANPDDDDDGDDTGLSTGAKAGIGVGISLGAIALSAIIAVLVLARKKTKQQQQKSEEDGSTTLGSGGGGGPDAFSPATATAAAAAAAQYEHREDQKAEGGAPPQQLDGTARAELHAPQPVYELPGEAYSRELVVVEEVERGGRGG